MFLKCWILATIAGFLAFAAGVLIAAAVMLRTSEGDRASVVLRGWHWLDKMKSNLSEKDDPDR